MAKRKRYLFVCVNRRPDGTPKGSCAARGAVELHARLKERLKERGLAATEDDIDARVEEIASANQTTPAKVYASLQKAGRLDAIERELTERKVFEFLTSQSEIT